jgi:hypothetical protein
MKWLPVTVVALLFAVGCSLVLWRTEWFQQRFFPRTYWHQKVTELKKKVAASEFSLGHFAIELEKKRRTADLEATQKANISELVGMDSARATKEAIEQISKEIKGLTDVLRIMQEGLEKDRERLASAEEQLVLYAK